MIDEKQILDGIIENLGNNDHFNRHQLHVLRVFAIDLDAYIEDKLLNFKQKNIIGDI
jgi:hypothetical protein